MMAAQLVKLYRKSQRSNNDRNDAEAIATAAREGNMRFVPIKSIDQQARLSWHGCAEAPRRRVWRLATVCAAFWPSLGS